MTATAIHVTLFKISGQLVTQLACPCEPAAEHCFPELLKQNEQKTQKLKHY